MSVPHHVAIIPDGNRRWAKERGKDPWEGHYAGAENIEHLVRRAYDEGVVYLTLWGSSVDNLSKRPLVEKKALLDVYTKYFKRLLTSDDIFQKKAKIVILGKWREQFPDSLVKLLEEGMEKTKDHDERFLIFFLAYNGDDEMVDVVREIAHSGVNPNEITHETIKERLYTKDFPPVDLLIRTGGEPHLSAGFMMWDLRDSELYFSDKMFPDFMPDELSGALKEYDERGRRKGR